MLLALASHSDQPHSQPKNQSPTMAGMCVQCSPLLLAQRRPSTTRTHHAHASRSQTTQADSPISSSGMSPQMTSFAAFRLNTRGEPSANSCKQFQDQAAQPLLLAGISGVSDWTMQLQTTFSYVGSAPSPPGLPPAALAPTTPDAALGQVTASNSSAQLEDRRVHAYRQLKCPTV